MCPVTVLPLARIGTVVSSPWRRSAASTDDVPMRSDTTLVTPPATGHVIPFRSLDYVMTAGLRLPAHLLSDDAPPLDFTAARFRCLIREAVERFHARAALVFQEETRPFLAPREGLFTSGPAKEKKKNRPGDPEAVRCSLLSRLTETEASVGVTPPPVNGCRSGTLVKGSLPPRIGPHCAFHVTAIPTLCA
jgi:hypothetical protein